MSLKYKVKLNTSPYIGNDTHIGYEFNARNEGGMYYILGSEFNNEHFYPDMEYGFKLSEIEVLEIGTGGE